MSRTVIILAAGSGTRLRPFTRDRPKVMVPLHGRTLLEWQGRAIRAAGGGRVVVVCGYREESVPADGVTKVLNPRFASTNMVESLWCAEEFFGDGITVSYGDIVYEPGVLEALWADPSPAAVIVDTAWKAYWARRFPDVLADAESLRLDRGGRITSIGQKESSADDIRAQYIGLFRLDRATLEAAARVRREARPLEPALPGWAPPPRPIEKWYMTDLLHALVHSRVPLRALPVEGRWLEIDSLGDLRLAEELAREDHGHLRIMRRA